MNVIIVKFTRPEAKEGRSGRIYERMVTTWDVVTEDGCSLLSEEVTRRAARAYAADRGHTVVKEEVQDAPQD